MSEIISVYQPDAGVYIEGAARGAIRLGLEYFMFNTVMFQQLEVKGKTHTFCPIGYSGNMPKRIQVTVE